MKLCYKILAIAIVASTGSFISCAGPAAFSYQNVTLVLSYNPICTGVCINGNVFTPVPAGVNTGPVGAIEMPVAGGSGSCLTITATVTNAPPTPTWTVYPTPAPGATSNSGYMDGATGATNAYCMFTGGTIPIYSGVELAQATALGLQQGETEVVVTVPADPNNPADVVSASMQFTYELNTTGQKPGSIGIGIQPGSVTIPLSTATTPSTYQFTGYIVGINGYEGAGATVNTPAKLMTWEVNTVVGGAGTGAGQFGTISSTGLYTAPLAYPSATVHTATINGVSAAYPTIVSGNTTVTFP